MGDLGQRGLGLGDLGGLGPGDLGEGFLPFDIAPSLLRRPALTGPGGAFGPPPPGRVVLVCYRTSWQLVVGPSHVAALLATWRSCMSIRSAKIRSPRSGGRWWRGDFTELSIGWGPYRIRGCRSPEPVSPRVRTAVSRTSVICLCPDYTPPGSDLQSGTDTRFCRGGTLFLTETS